jgi:hypothetical protein
VASTRRPPRPPGVEPPAPRAAAGRTEARLLGNKPFRHLFAAQGVSIAGSQVTLLALPLTAAELLHASPFQMGLLGFAQYVPWLLFSLHFGALADRSRRRALMVACDLARLCAVAVVPVLWAIGRLNFLAVWLVAFAVGTLTVLFNVANQALLPEIVSREQLVNANASLLTIEQTGTLAGPGIAGVLVQAVGAPVALVVDAASYLLSASFLTHIPAHAVPSRPGQQTVRRQIAEGWRAMWHTPVLRGLALCSGFANMFAKLLAAVYVLFALRTLHMSPLMLGATYAVGSAGSLLGATVAPRVSRRLGVTGATLAGQLAAGPCIVLIGQVRATGWAGATQVAACMFVWYGGWSVYGTNSAALRQASVANELQGRLAASTRFISYGFASIGLLAGGAVGEIAGFRLAITIGGIGVFAATGWLLAGRSRGARNAGKAWPAAATAET